MYVCNVNDCHLALLPHHFSLILSSASFFSSTSLYVNTLKDNKKNPRNEEQLTEFGRDGRNDWGLGRCENREENKGRDPPLPSMSFSNLQLFFIGEGEE
jgi:hypothetical protein